MMSTVTSTTHRSLRNHARGITLLELLASLSLAVAVGLLSYTLYRQSQGTLKQWFSRQDSQAQQLAFSRLWSNLLLRGQGLLEVGESGLEVLTADGRRLRLWQEFGDSLATLNGKDRSDSICDLKIKVWGSFLNPDPFSGSLLSTENPALRDDSLDTNRDGLIDFSELDGDRDNSLDSLELGHVRLIEMQWRRCGEKPGQRRLVVAPRNRVAKPPPTHSAKLM